MKKIKKADFIIIAVLLAVIVCAVLFSAAGKKNEKTVAPDEIPVQSKQVTYNDYNGKKIGILTGTNMEAESFKYFPDSEYLYYDGYPNLNTSLMNGAIDAYLGDEPALKSIHAAQPSIDYIKERLTNNKYSFAFRKNDEAEAKLCGQLNDFLKKSRDDGTIAEIDSIWFGNDDSRKIVDMSGLTGENGTIHVVTTSTDEPFSYIKNGEHVGYDIDVTVRFCREYGYALEIGDVDFQARIPALASGKYEFTTSMNVTPEREEEVMFSDPVSEGGIVVAVRTEDLGSGGSSSSAEKAPYDYSGKKIGVQTGTIFDETVSKNIPDADISYYNSYTDLLSALKAGIIDGFAADEPMIKYMMTEDSSVDYLKKYMDDYSFGFAFAKNAEGKALCSEFSEFIRKIKSDGTLDEIDDIWFGTDESRKVIPDTSTLTGEKLSLALESGIAPFVYIQNNEIVGYEIDIAYRFCKEYGYGLKLVDMNFDGIIPAVSSGKCSFGCSGITITDERRESVVFSESVYDGGCVLAVRSSDLADTAGTSGSAEPSYTEYNGKRIGIKTASSFEQISFNEFPDSEYFYFDTTGDLITALTSDKIDGFLEDEPTAKMMNIENSEADYLKNIIMKDDYCFGFAKTDKAQKILGEFNAYLDDIKSDGEIEALDEKWFSKDEAAKIIDRSGLTGENGEIVVAVRPDNEPFAYVADNETVGYAVEIMTEFARKYGYTLRFEQGNSAACIAGLAAGKYDVLAGSLSVTEERRQSMLFSDVVYNGGVVLVVRSSDLAAYGGKEIAEEQPEKTFFGSIKESFNKNFIREDRYKLILEGIGTTCIITVLSVIFGSVLAFLICLFRRADSVLSGKISDLYVKLLQGTPMVVLLMILYYVIFGRSGIAAMWVAVIGFSLNFAAYVSEILRSGIDSIDGGQREAALALGYTENQAFFRFIFPQAAIRQLPVYRGEIISLLKNTSIVGYIAIQDLTKMSDIIRSRTYEAFFPLIVTAVIYFILAWIISLILKFVLRNIDPKAKRKSSGSAAVNILANDEI